MTTTAFTIFRVFVAANCNRFFLICAVLLGLTIIPILIAAFAGQPNDYSTLLIATGLGVHVSNVFIFMTVSVMVYLTGKHEIEQHGYNEGNTSFGLLAPNISSTKN